MEEAATYTADKAKRRKGARRTASEVAECYLRLLKGVWKDYIEGRIRNSSDVSGEEMRAKYDICSPFCRSLMDKYIESPTEPTMEDAIDLHERIKQRVEEMAIKRRQEKKILEKEQEDGRWVQMIPKMSQSFDIDPRIKSILEPAPEMDEEEAIRFLKSRGYKIYKSVLEEI